MRATVALTRIQQSWLAGNERKLMEWTAARLPNWVKPDYLTALGLLGAMLCGAGFAGAQFSPAALWFVCLGLIVNWWGDSLDGNLARVRKIERPRYGFFVDHATDVVAQACVFLGLGLSPYMRFDTACLLLLSYWLASLFTFIRAVATNVFQISYWGVGPTEIRLGLLGYTAGLITFGAVVITTPFGTISPLDSLAIPIFITVFISYIWMAWSTRRELALLDRLPVVVPAVTRVAASREPPLPEPATGLAALSQ